MQNRYLSYAQSSWKSPFCIITHFERHLAPGSPCHWVLLSPGSRIQVLAHLLSSPGAAEPFVLCFVPEILVYLSLTPCLRCECLENGACVFSYGNALIHFAVYNSTDTQKINSTESLKGRETWAQSSETNVGVCWIYMEFYFSTLQRRTLPFFTALLNKTL